jgi:hypothetical protein
VNIVCNENHEYFVDGKLTPGVTEIMAAEGLIDLRKIPISVLEPARALGTEVHRVCELWDKQKLDIRKVDPVILPYLKAWLLFLKDIGPEFVEIEEMIYSKMYNVCGKPDRIARIKGREGLLDLKSTTTLQPSIKIQTGGYLKIWEEFRKRKLYFRWAIQLKPDGTYKIEKHLDYIDSMRAISAFVLYQYKKEKGLYEDAKYTKELFQYGGV